MDAKWKVHPILDADGTCAHKHLHCLLLRSCGANNGYRPEGFYFHVAAAWIGLLAFCVVFGASIAYLRRRQDRMNHLALASAEIGTVFISGTLLTGPLWAYPIWNTWWTWDPRLTTTLVLWFMYVAYLALQSGERQKRESACRLSMA